MKKRKGCRLFRSLVARCKRSNKSDTDVAKPDTASVSSDELLNAQQQAGVTMQQQPPPGSPSASSASSASSTSRKPFKKKEKSPGGRSKKNKTPKSSTGTAASADIEVIASTEVLSTNMGRAKLNVQQKNKRLPSMTHLRMIQDRSSDAVVQQPTVIVHADQQGIPQTRADMKNTTEQSKSVVETSREKSPVRVDIVATGKNEITAINVVRPAEDCDVAVSERPEVSCIAVSPGSHATQSAQSVNAEQKITKKDKAEKLGAAEDGTQISSETNVNAFAEPDSPMPEKVEDLTELVKSQQILSTESVSIDASAAETGLGSKTRKLRAVPSNDDQPADSSTDSTEVNRKRSEKVDWNDFGKPKEKPVDVGSTEFGEIFSKVRKQRSDLSLKGQQNGVTLPGEIADGEAEVGGKLEPKLSLTKTDLAESEMPKILMKKLRSSSRKIGIADQTVVETEEKSDVEISKEPTKKLPSTSMKIGISNPTSEDSEKKSDTLKTAIHKSASLQKASEPTTGVNVSTLPKSVSLNEKERPGAAKPTGTEESNVNPFVVSLKPTQPKKLTCVVDEKTTSESLQISPSEEQKSKPPKSLPAKPSTLERRKKPMAEKEDNTTSSSPEDPDVTIESGTWPLKKPPPSGRMATPGKKEMAPITESNCHTQLDEQLSGSSAVFVGVRTEADGCGSLRRDGHQRKISLDRPVVAADDKKGQSSAATSNINASTSDISGKHAAADVNKPVVSTATVNMVQKNVAGQDEKSSASTGEAVPPKFSIIPKAKISSSKATGGNSAKPDPGSDGSRAITESSLSIAADSTSEKTPLNPVVGKKPVVKRPTAKVQPTEPTPEEPAWVVAAKRKSREWSSGVVGEDLDRRESEKLAKKTSTDSTADDSSFQRFGNRGSVRDIVKKLQGQQPIS